MRPDFDWIDDPEITTTSKLNEKLFSTKDAEAHGFKAGQEVLSAASGFMTEMQADYRPLFLRIRPHEAYCTAGIVLHRSLELTTCVRSEPERVDTVLDLLDFLIFKGNANTKEYGFLMIAEYFDYLEHRGSQYLKYAGDQLIKMAERRNILKHLWSPAVPLAELGKYCLYNKISEAIARLQDPNQWLMKNISQGTMLSA